jgi:2-polyprenyl-3-methyl-5-hydroxy-6-metoxy-1,4-benzoquinol methylase
MQAEYGQKYAELYNRHWWWRARESILVRELRRLPLPTNARVLDVGCGDGLFFPRLREFGSVQGIESDQSLIRADNPDRAFIHDEPLGSPRYAGMQFDLITACDVIEHIEDDSAAVSHMLALLSPTGFLVITVPAFMALWDEHDELNKHYRRYTTATLRAAIPARSKLLKLEYLFHTIFLPKLAVRTLNRHAKQKVDQSTIPNPIVNHAMRAVCIAEKRLVGSLKLPFGTSVFAIVQKLAWTARGRAASSC